MDQIISREKEKGDFFYDCHLNYQRTNIFSYVLIKDGEITLDDLNNLPDEITNKFSFFKNILFVEDNNDKYKCYVIEPKLTERILSIKKMSEIVYKLRLDQTIYDPKNNKHYFEFRNKSIFLNKTEFKNYDKEGYYFAEFKTKKTVFAYQAPIFFNTDNLDNIINKIYDELSSDREIMVNIFQKSKKIKIKNHPFVFYNFENGDKNNGVLSILPIKELKADCSVDMSYIKDFNYENGLPLMISFYNKENNSTGIYFFPLENINPILIKESKMNISESDNDHEELDNKCCFCLNKTIEIKNNKIETLKKDDIYEFFSEDEYKLSKCEKCLIYFLVDS